MVNGDAGRLEQVITNLLNNAIRYAPQSERVEVRLQHADSNARLEVQDFGPGIPTADLQRIFSHFYQVQASGSSANGGLGLGLYICGQIVAAHSGSIDVESTEGKGTTFTVRLPLSEALG